MLAGQKRLVLDDKGRLSVPASWRHALHELYAPNDQPLVVMKGFDRCLAVYPKAVWLNVQEQLLALPNDANTRAFIRHFCASASVCNLDRPGRILIPPDLRQYAGIESEVVMVALMNRFEVWSAEHWDVEEAKNGNRLEQLSRFINIKG